RDSNVGAGGTGDDARYAQPQRFEESIKSAKGRSVVVSSLAVVPSPWRGDGARLCRRLEHKIQRLVSAGDRRNCRWALDLEGMFVALRFKGRRLGNSQCHAARRLAPCRGHRGGVFHALVSLRGMEI